jgi:hypothetical protein
MSDDPLDQIFVKPEQVEGENRALLAKMIFPFAGVSAETGEVHFKATADDLNSKQKIIVYLLCRLALSTRPDTVFAVFAAAVSPKEVERGTDLPGGTVRPKLSQLVDERIVVKSGDGYTIPSSSLKRAYKELEAAIPES